MCQPVLNAVSILIMFRGAARSVLSVASRSASSSSLSRWSTPGARRAASTSTRARRGSGTHAVSLALFVAIGSLVNVLVVGASDAAASPSSSDDHQQQNAQNGDSMIPTTPYASVQSATKTYQGVYSAVPPTELVSCPMYGCPVLPRDIAFDDSAKKALESIRQLYSADSDISSKSNDDVDNMMADENGDGEEYSSEDGLRTLGSAGGNDHATLTLIGYKGGRMDDQVNQDRAFLISPYMSAANPQDTDSAVSSSSSGSSSSYPRRLVGVFDGHGRGGEFVSDHTVTKLPELLASKLTAALNNDQSNKSEEEEAIKKILFDSFVEIDKTSANLVPDHVTGGCTATVVLQLGPKAYIANAGDSRSLIATYSKTTKDVKVVYVTREDKPHLPEERQRVEQMGGRVRLPQQPGGTSRVMYRDSKTGNEWGLAMSRSIGDWAAGEVGVIPDPIVDVVSLADLTRSDAAGTGGKTCTVSADGEQECLAAEAEVVEGDLEVFAVSATDGLLDYVSVDDIAKHVALGLYDDGNDPHLLSACEQLISAAAGGWQRHRQGRYRDDIAISVSKLTW